MAIIPAIIIFGQEEGITIVKDGKLEVNTVFDPDSLRDGSPSLSKRELRKQRWHSAISITTYLAAPAILRISGCL